MAAIECLQRAEPAFVVHFAVAVDPVTQVEVPAAFPSGPLQLLEDGHGKMDYKRRFRPLEAFDGRHWRDLDDGDPA